MIDLHLHFDGSIPVETVWEQAKKQHITLPADSLEALKTYMVCPRDCKDLNEYLQCFDVPLMVLQTKEGIFDCMKALIDALKKEHMLYAEIRFAPQLHTKHGLSQEEVVQAACKAVKACTDESLKVQLILCCMRGADNKEQNMETIQLAAKYLGEGVCACDLAGAEALFPTEQFADVFSYASRLAVPFTIHAGEAAGAKSIQTALLFGAVRIGHGVRALEDMQLMQQLQTKRIALECCPTSNVQTKAVACLEKHPLRYFLEHGFLVTVNTDNRTVSDTTIAKEMQLLKEAISLTKQEEKQLYLNAVEAAFLEEEEKKKLRIKIQNLVA